MSPQPRIEVKLGSAMGAMGAARLATNGPALFIKNEHFEGSIAVRIESFLGPLDDEGIPTSEYFDARGGGITWSIGVQGRFKGEPTADDVLFGNAWEHPIREHLPYGTSIGLAFMHKFDPSLSADLMSDTPHAESPLLATMNYLSVVEHPVDQELPSFDTKPVVENVELILPEIEAGDGKARKKWFTKEQNRKSVTIKENQLWLADFCNPFIDFPTLSVKLPIAILPNIPLLPHWDGAPVTFICRSRDHSKVYFVIEFNIVDLLPPVEKRKVVEEKPTAVDVEKAEAQSVTEQDSLGVD